eukprot:c18551_g1_i2.p1 GENE.c18551_g1_i2~~c18551_g1_i2.p1  ORF type:complete len:109 (-),score=24.81 c18551_g1_i2:265-591(-)
MFLNEKKKGKKGKCLVSTLTFVSAWIQSTKDSRRTSLMSNELTGDAEFAGQNNKAGVPTSRLSKVPLVNKTFDLSMRSCVSMNMRSNPSQRENFVVAHDLSRAKTTRG